MGSKPLDDGVFEGKVSILKSIYHTRTMPISENLAALVVGFMLAASCGPNKPEKTAIVYINSYHQGHPSSDEIMQGFMDNMPIDSFEIHAWYMDTKRNPTEEFIIEKASQLLDSIQKINPDVLVVSDDNAVKYIVEPNLQSLEMSVIFCGVNWTDQEYELPKDQVTGIIEILPVFEALQTIKYFDPSMDKVVVLSENTTTSRKEEQILDTLFQRAGFTPEFRLVNDFERWKESFLIFSETTDLIYIPTHAAIRGWDDKEAKAFVEENINIPIITCEDFMMPFAVLGVTKIAKEHGEWAAATTKKILAGMSVSEIPVTRNKQSVLWFNQGLADQISLETDKKFLNRARVID